LTPLFDDGADASAEQTVAEPAGNNASSRRTSKKSPVRRRPRGVGCLSSILFSPMFAVLHIEDFSLQAVLRVEPDPVEQPFALIDETSRPPLVIACTPAARAAGVERGQTGPQAMARCAEISLRTARPDAETEARASLLAAAFSVSPQIEYTAPGVCTMQVAGLAEERREPALRAALAQLRQLGLAATAGLAATPLLALYAARHGRTRLREQKPFTLKSEGAGRPLAGAMEARASSRPASSRGSATSSAPGVRRNGSANVGCELARAFVAAEDPDPVISRHADSSCQMFGTKNPRLGEDAARDQICEDTKTDFRALAEQPRDQEYLCVKPNEAYSFLKNLPLSVAEPPAEIAEILAGWGVRTLGELTALAKADVTQRLGPAGLALWERAAGEVTRPLRMISPPQTFTAEMTVEHEIETLEPLLFLLRRLIDRLALELRNAGFVAGEMMLRLMLSDETVYTREFRLPEPTAREEILFRVLHTHLETLHTATTVQGVSLECRPVRPLARQQGLFESALRDPHGFAETLGRVATVIGADRVGTPGLENTHRPDAVVLTAPAAVVPPLTEGGLRVHVRDGAGPICRSGFTPRCAASAAGAEGGADLRRDESSSTGRQPALEGGWLESDSNRGVKPLLQCQPAEDEIFEPVFRGLPLRRYRPPIPATVELSGQVPTFVWTSLVTGAVRAQSGPWRGSGDWWDASRRWAREEWDVELESGGVYRLLLVPEGWFVEGEYD